MSLEFGTNPRRADDHPDVPVVPAGDAGASAKATTPVTSQAEQDSKTLASDHEGESFAEVALRLGGATADEARRTGAVDAADDRVEDLFAPQYKTVNSPVHRAVWDQRVPTELFASTDDAGSASVQKVVDHSLEVVRLHRDQGTLLNEQGKIAERVLDELGAAGYWGLLVDPKNIGGSRHASMRCSSPPFITRMAMHRPHHRRDSPLFMAVLALLTLCAPLAMPIRKATIPCQG